MILTLLFAVAAASWFLMALGAAVLLRHARRLPSLAELCGDSGGPVDEAPFCSIVIAARDEGTRIESTVRRLLAQTGVKVEVIVVNDRSRDETEEILQRLAAEDLRVHPLQVATLPEGWLGKCHACHLGAEAAKGNWILFTDGDSWLKPDLIQRALLVAAREKVEHITMTMGVEPETLAGRAWHIAFLMTLAGHFAGVNRDRPKAYLGMGAFNLVKSDAYRACGGYEALRMTIVDDLRLGFLLRRAGCRTRGFIGGNDLQCDWGVNATRMIAHMEKNYFAAADFRLGAAMCLSIGNTLQWLAAILGPFTGKPAGMAAGLGLLAMILPASMITRRLGWSLWSAVATPFFLPLVFYAILRSTVLTVSQKGVWWRDTFYPLAALRAGTVR